MNRGINLPSDWMYLEVVLPALKIGEPMAYLECASPLILAGLKILQGGTSSQARAGMSGTRLKTTTGLFVPVREDERDKAIILKRRLNREAAIDGDRPWRTREVLTRSLFFGAHSHKSAGGQ